MQTPSTLRGVTHDSPMLVPEQETILFNVVSVKDQSYCDIRRTSRWTKASKVWQVGCIKNWKKSRDSRASMLLRFQLNWNLTTALIKIYQSFYVVNSNLSPATRGGPLGVVKKPCVKTYFKFNGENSSKEGPLKGSFKVKNYQFRFQMQVDIKSACKLMLLNKQIPTIFLTKNRLLYLEWKY